MPSIRVPFTITTRPSSFAADAPTPVVGLTTFDKVFASGSLHGSSVVQMVSALGAAGPLAYVALERVEGDLDGHAGAFVLRHVGAIVAGAPTLDLEVVEGSGTEELEGLSGRGTIEHTAEGAYLTLDYLLPS